MFLYWSMCFRYFLYYLPSFEHHRYMAERLPILRKTLYNQSINGLIKLECSLLKDDLCHIWLKIAQWFCRRRCLNVVDVFLLFWYFLPLEKGLVLHLHKLNSFIIGCSVVSLVRVLEKNTMCKKNLRTPELVGLAHQFCAS